MTNLTDLARRVSELQGPSREVDVVIWKAVFPDDYRSWESRASGMLSRDATPEARQADLARKARQAAKPFTGSQDAAMTLVADGRLISLETYDDNGVYPEHVRASAWVQGAPRQFAATPALALTAAAITARSEA